MLSPLHAFSFATIFAVCVYYVHRCKPIDIRVRGVEGSFCNHLSKFYVAGEEMPLNVNVFIFSVSKGYVVYF